MKTCTQCGSTKPESDFYERKKETGKFQSHCRSCAKARARAWQMAHPERQRANALRSLSQPGARDRRNETQRRYRERIKQLPGARWEQVKKMPHVLYRTFDQDGVLLYVGITSCFNYRMKCHAESKPWWGDVARIESEEHPDRASADSAETKAIRGENPLYNIRKR